MIEDYRPRLSCIQAAPRTDTWQQLIRDQNGLLDTDQLQLLGIGPGVVAANLKAQRWRRVLPRVYATFTGPLTRAAQITGALLYGGPRAVLSHRTAAEEWRMLRIDPLAPVHITAQALRSQLAALPPDDLARLRFLERMLRSSPVLLVLDNFEDNLTPDGGRFADEGTAAVIERLAESCATGKLLVTCRYPLPGLQDLLRQISVGPLSPSEIRRLFLRLKGLRTLPDADVTLVDRLVGGHPRVLEFLDALLQRGVGTTQVRHRFLELARAHKVDVTEARELREHVAVAVQLGARDICLDVLLAELDDAEREVLLQTAVSNLPVVAQDLVAGLTDSGLDDTVIKRVAQRLVDLSLLVQTDEELWVHRWTAEGLRERQPRDNHRRRCRQAGELRLRRMASAARDVAEWIETTQNFLDAEEWDQAAEVASEVANFLAQNSNLQRLAFVTHVLASLPSHHHAYDSFVDHEGMALVALGFTNEAVERYQRLVDTFSQRTQAEPGRADYQRDLSVSYCSKRVPQRSSHRGTDPPGNSWRNATTSCRT